MGVKKHDRTKGWAENPEATGDAAERRRYFRVEDHLILEYRPLAPGEREHAVQNLKEDQPSRHLIASSFASTSQQMKYVLRKVQEREPEIALYLETLNEKLDLLARQLAMETTELSEQRPRKVDISAAGISFEADHSLEENSLLDLKMLLFPSFDYIRAVGRVVRCQAIGDTQEGRVYRLAVDFDYLRDDDLELLAQHVTKKESSRIREERADPRRE